jgi:PST family polysaccharide transporter
MDKKKKSHISLSLSRFSVITTILKNKIKNFKSVVFNNKSVIENYFFMTILQILNSFFYLLIYPYLIRVLGSEGYGTFVFATSIATYFLFFINFGFDLPATKAIAENAENSYNQRNILSCIFTSKSYLFIISSLVFGILLFTVPVFEKNKEVFLLCFFNVYSFVLFPQWYFQGIQKMKIVTYIQLGLKLASLPLIFLLIKSPQDLILYVFIISITNILGSLIAYLIIRLKYKIDISWVKPNRLKVWFKESQPFFFSSLAGSIKEYSIPIIIGSFFGMKDVAIYDLANKIIIVPRTIFMGVNSAIFPKLIVNIRNNLVKKIIRTEFFVSFSVVVVIIVFGKFIVKFLGGSGMENSYYLAVLLGFTVVSWLVVGAFINFVFIPNDKNYFITANQVIAMVAFFIFCIGGLMIYKNIIIFGVAMALSGMLEILYCVYITKKHQLLK